MAGPLPLFTGGRVQCAETLIIPRTPGKVWGMNIAPSLVSGLLECTLNLCVCVYFNCVLEDILGT